MKEYFIRKKKVKQERDIWPRTLPPARSLMSIAHAVMATIITVMSLMASEAGEICENYCQIQLGSFRLNSAVRPPGPSLISYQIERGIGMLELNPDARAITLFWRQLIEEGWPYPTTLISIIADIFLLVVVQPAIYSKGTIVLTTPVFQCNSLHCLVQNLWKGGKKNGQVQLGSHHTIHSVWRG